MTTQIEKEFFEAMSIEPREFYRPDDEIYWGNKETTIEFSQQAYPLITSDIILGLIKLLIDNGQTLKIFEASEMFKDHTRYIVNAETELRHDIYGTGANLSEAVLKLCMRFDHIKQSVQKLFKDGGE